MFDLTVFVKRFFQPWWQVLVIGERQQASKDIHDYPYNSNSP